MPVRQIQTTSPTFQIHRQPLDGRKRHYAERRNSADRQQMAEDGGT